MIYLKGNYFILRYFKEDLYASTIDFSKTVEERRIANKQWQEACDQYALEMKKLYNKLPPKFYHMLENGFFHDASIDSLTFLKNRSKKRKITYDIILSITYKEKHSAIIHKNINNFQSDIDLSEGYIDFGDYMYGEIIFENGFWIHNFIFYNYSEINIKCEKIEWKPE